MKKLSIYFQRFVAVLFIGVLFIASFTEMSSAAGPSGSFISLGKACCKGILPSANGGFGTVPNASAVAAAASAPNAAGGLVVVDSDGKLPALDGSKLTGIVGASGPAAAGELTGDTVASNVVHSSLLDAAGGTFGPGAFGDAPVPTSGAAAVNDIPYVASQTAGVPTLFAFAHHPAAQSSASTAVTLDETWFDTTTPNILTAASAVTVSFPTAASVPAAVGTIVYLQQEGGDVTASGVSAAVTLNAEGGKKTTNGLHAIMGCIYRGTDIWDCFGNRK